MKYEEIVLKLLKPAEQMKQEWTNDEKQKLFTLSDAFDKASVVSSGLWSYHPALGNPTDYCVHHMIMGILGELGELLDTTKKAIIYRKEWDNENIIEEFGDIIFYTTGMSSFINSYPGYYKNVVKEFNDFIMSLSILMNTFGIDPNLAKQKNKEKLEKRYPNFEYADTKAKERLDKAEFISLNFDISGEMLCVDFFPDIPMVCHAGHRDKLENFHAVCGQSFDHELLVEMCQSKISKEKND